MSFQSMAWCLGKADTIAAQAVLFSVAHHADHWGITYIGQETIAEECSCRKATVTTNLQKLSDVGLIARVQRRDERGRRTSDHLVLAPNHLDRGGMADSDKLAREKHPIEVCELATQGTPGVPSEGGSLSTPDESQGTPDGRLGALGVPELTEELTERTDKAARGQEELVTDERVPKLIEWFIRRYSEQTGEVIVKVPKTWDTAARRLVEKDGAEVSAVLAWAWAKGDWWWTRTKTLPLLAKNWADARGAWKADAQKERNRPQRRDEPVHRETARVARYDEERIRFDD